MRTITVLTTTTLLALGTMSPAGATYEGQEGRIAFGAFVATDRTQGDIWSVRPDGQALRQLTDAAGLDICPAYSADGKHIAFCSNRTGAYEIWVMDANGKDERQVTELGARSLFPDFSPDGSQIAFAAPVVAGGVTDLWTVPSAGGTPTRVTDTPDVAERLPVWSPDGSTLLYVAGPPDQRQRPAVDPRRRDRRPHPAHVRRHVQGPDARLEPGRTAHRLRGR